MLEPPATRRLPRNRGLRLLIVDDHRVLLEALAAALGRRPGIEVVGTAASIAELSRRPYPRPDVVLLDYRLADGTAIEGARLAKTAWPGTRVLLMSAGLDDETVLAAAAAGADGYVEKSMRLGALLDAIVDVAAGAPRFAPELLASIARRLVHPAPARAPGAVVAPLTRRELTVLKALAMGASTAAMSRDLGISEGTVRRHVEAIRRKLHVHSRLEAVSAAIQHRLLELPSPSLPISRPQPPS